MKITLSLCPVCQKEIDAIICAGVMVKVCSDHGEFASVVEADKSFFDHWTNNNNPEIYPGHLVDVTTRCNLECRYCYFEKGAADISIEKILEDCHKAPGPYILTGGEPTIRPDMHEVINNIKLIGQPVMLTNGYGLQDKNGLMRYAKQLKNPDTGIVEIGLSYHPEAPWIDTVLQNIADCNLELSTLFFVIDDMEQLPGIKMMAESFAGSFKSFRIKIAAEIWNEKKGSPPIYASDVVKWFMAQPGETVLPDLGKITFLPFYHNGVFYSVIKWYDAANVDLLDIATAPTYTAKNGETMDFVRAMLYNGANK